MGFARSPRRRSVTAGRKRRIIDDDGDDDDDDDDDATPPKAPRFGDLQLRRFAEIFDTGKITSTKAGTRRQRLVKEFCEECLPNIVDRY